VRRQNNDRGVWQQQQRRVQRAPEMRQRDDRMMRRDMPNIARDDRRGNRRERERTIRNAPIWGDYGYSDRDRRSGRENRSDRARWNRDSNGTPPWANRNYETPAWAHARNDARRAERQI